MLGLDRRVLQTLWTVFVFVLALVMIYEIRSTLVLFTLAVFLATLISPIVERVHWLIPPSGSRAPAIALVYLAFMAILVGLAIPIGSKITDEAATLGARLPSAIQADPLAHMPLPARLEGWRPQVNQFIRGRMEQFSQNVLPMLSEAGGRILSGVGSLLVLLVLIPILSFFALKDAVTIRRALLRSIDTGARDLVDAILNDLHLVLAQYMRALLFLAMATFISYVTFLSLMGVPYAVLLAGVAASLEFIPVIGPLSGAGLVLLVAGISGYSHVLWLVLFFGAYRMFQDYVLSPMLMSSGVELHPLLVLLGVLAGDQLAGIPGMFFSVPVIAALRVVLVRIHKHNREAV